MLHNPELSTLNCGVQHHHPAQPLCAKEFARHKNN
jgi:hypothetical protein